MLHPDYPLHSRVHSIKAFISPATNRQVWIKRDDELGSGITGSKWRKLAGIISFLLKNHFEEVVMTGSEKSNFVVSALQLLNENQIVSKLFLLESHDKRVFGNALWLRLLHDSSMITWVSRADWENIDTIARDYMLNSGKNSTLLPLGGDIPEAVIGAMSLAEDILLNEQVYNIHFDSIFLDSGSGVTAIGTILGMALQPVLPSTIYISLIAGTEEEFRKNLLYYQNALTQQYGFVFKDIPTIAFLVPSINRSFGAVGNPLLTEVASLAKMEGILAEPVYTMKHLLTVREHIYHQNPDGNLLIVNSGGALGLAGFQKSLGAFPFSA